MRWWPIRKHRREVDEDDRRLAEAAENKLKSQQAEVDRLERAHREHRRKNSFRRDVQRSLLGGEG